MTPVRKTKRLFTSGFACLLAVFSFMIIPEIAAAASAPTFNWAASFSAFGLTFRFGNAPVGANGIASALCTIVGWFEGGGVGAAVASMAVIFMGIAAFFGKVTWGMALTTACGIFAIFGSSEIIQAITGGFGSGCF